LICAGQDAPFVAHTPPGRTRELIFRFVRERLLAGSPPTVREVQAEFGFRAVESARAQLEALVAEGRLAKAGGARGWRLPDVGPTRHVPLLGAVQAGALTEAIEHVDGYVATHARHGRDHFALRVRGDSMRDAAILDGDVVVVRRQESARNGAIVVAQVGDEATVKTLRLVRGPGGVRVELHPANPDFPPIVPPPEEARILGVVVEVRRTIEEGRR
jgi:repressor LexA